MNVVRSLSSALLVVVAAAACVSQHSAPPGAAVRSLGESFKTTHGEVFLMRVQDEYVLIRCIPEGPIAGCYENVYRIQRDAITDDATSTGAERVRWNQWVPVKDVPGLEIMFLDPGHIALRELPVAAGK
jgi:hypothetical protein